MTLDYLVEYGKILQLYSSGQISYDEMAYAITELNKTNKNARIIE